MNDKAAGRTKLGNTQKVIGLPCAVLNDELSFGFVTFLS
jgi:hypothetical protein